MNRYFQEVIDAHQLISDVLGEHDASGDKRLQLLARFNPAFTMVAPNGAIFDHQRLVDFFEQQQGTRPGLTISLFDFILKSRYSVRQELLSAYMGLYGLIVLTVNIALSGYISSERRKAATIQEMYDCNVLRIKWNDLRVGKKISRDNVFRAARFYQDRPDKAQARFGSEGWYVNKFYDAPQSVMALLCHGKNFGWDRSLRDRLNVFYIWGISISFFSLLLYAVMMKATLNDGLFYVVFTLPLIRYILLQFLDNRKSRDRIEKVKDYIDKEISDIKIAGRFNNDDLNHKLRSIQDEVFSHRAMSPPVPNFIHLRMKKDNEAVYNDYFEENLRLMTFPES